MMRNRWIGSTLVTLTLGCLAAPCLGVPAVTVGTTTLTGTAKGAVSLSLADATGIACLRVQLSYDPTQLILPDPPQPAELLGADPAQWVVATKPDSFPDASGALEIVVVRADGFSGSGVVLSIPVKAAAGVSGEVALNAPGATGYDVSLQVLSVSTEGGTVTVSVIARMAQTMDRGWQLLSLPCVPGVPDPASVVGDDIADPVVYGWDTQTAAYVTPEVLEIGQAYWTLVPADATEIDVDGSPVTVDPFVCSFASAGWYLLGNPGNAPLPLGSCEVWQLDANGNPTGAGSGFGAAAALDSIPALAYTWQSNHYALTDAVTPWGGCWLLALRPCQLRLPTGASRARLFGATERVPTGADGWSFVLQADSAAGSDSVVVGAAAGASDGFDGFNVDSPKPPPGPSALRAYFEHPDWQSRTNGAVGPWYHTDTRAQIARQTVWEFTVELQDGGRSPFLGARRADAPQQVTLTWPDLTGVPNDVSLLLADATTQERRYMRTTNSYPCTVRPGERRRFQLIAEPGTSARLQLTNVVVQPSRGGGLEVQYSLNKAAIVQAQIRSATGRVIGTMNTGRAAEVGSNTLTWRSRADAVLPRGVYVLELTARTDEGQVTRAVRSVVLR